MQRPRPAVLVAVATVVGVFASAACLGELPEATRCPPPAAHSACSIGPGSPLPTASSTPPPTPAAPPSPTASAGQPPVLPPLVASCTLATNSCLLAQRGSCACTAATECSRASSTCFPPPDCPTSVRNVEAQARCLDTSAASGPATVAGATSCQCGCPSCAVVCDGTGPVFGPNQTVQFALSTELPSRGQLGVMVRLRGVGRADVVARRATRTVSLGSASGSDSDFTEVVVTNTAAGTWNTTAERPVAVGLALDPNSNLEIDCVVPFYSP